MDGRINLCKNLTTIVRLLSNNLWEVDAEPYFRGNINYGNTSDQFRDNPKKFEIDRDGFPLDWDEAAFDDIVPSDMEISDKGKYSLLLYAEMRWDWIPSDIVEAWKNAGNKEMPGIIEYIKESTADRNIAFLKFIQSQGGSSYADTFGDLESIIDMPCDEKYEHVSEIMDSLGEKIDEDDLDGFWDKWDSVSGDYLDTECIGFEIIQEDGKVIVSFRYATKTHGDFIEDPYGEELLRVSTDEFYNPELFQQKFVLAWNTHFQNVPNLCRSGD